MNQVTIKIEEPSTNPITYKDPALERQYLEYTVCIRCKQYKNKGWACPCGDEYQY